MYRVEITSCTPNDVYKFELAIFSENGKEAFTTLGIREEVVPSTQFIETPKEIALLADKYNCFYSHSAFLGMYYDWSKKIPDPPSSNVIKTLKTIFGFQIDKGRSSAYGRLLP